MVMKRSGLYFSISTTSDFFHSLFYHSLTATMIIRNEWVSMCVDAVAAVVRSMNVDVVAAVMRANSSNTHVFTVYPTVTQYLAIVHHLDVITYLLYQRMWERERVNKREWWNIWERERFCIVFIEEKQMEMNMFQIHTNDRLFPLHLRVCVCVCVCMRDTFN